MIKVKIAKTRCGKFVVKARFLFFWWRAVEVDVIPRYNLAPGYKVCFIPEVSAIHFSSEYAASFFLQEVKDLLKY